MAGALCHVVDATVFVVDNPATAMPCVRFLIYVRCVMIENEPSALVQNLCSG